MYLTPPMDAALSPALFNLTPPFDIPALDNTTDCPDYRPLDDRITEDQNTYGPHPVLDPCACC